VDKEKKIFVFADFQPYHENFTLLSMIRNGWKREI